MGITKLKKAFVCPSVCLSVRACVHTGGEREACFFISLQLCPKFVSASENPNGTEA